MRAKRKKVTDEELDEARAAFEEACRTGTIKVTPERLQELIRQALAEKKRKKGGDNGT